MKRLIASLVLAGSSLAGLYDTTKASDGFEAVAPEHRAAYRELKGKLETLRSMLPGTYTKPSWESTERERLVGAMNECKTAFQKYVDCVNHEDIPKSLDSYVNPRTLLKSYDLEVFLSALLGAAIVPVVWPWPERVRKKARPPA